MFGFRKNEEQTSQKNTLAELKSRHQLELAELQTEHKLALKEKEFELKHFKDEEMQQLNKDLADEKQKNAVLQKENEMLQKITNLNADIIDIKALVNNLIEKLPTINLSSLTVNNGDKK